MPFRIEQLNVLNLATVGNSITAGSFVKSGGTSSQFLKADGSVDTNAYITGITSGMVTTALGYTPVPTTRTLTINGTAYDLSADRSWTISVPVSSVSGSGAGISVSPTTGAVVVSNTGVTSNVAGTGISVSGATGAVTITNTGVTSIVAGTAITISGATGAVTINNAGVTSLNGGTGAITGIATTAQLAGYLPLSGGTITGTLAVNSDFSVNTTRFTVNAATGNTVAAGSFTANSIIKSGGTSSQFLKADGSIDSNSYITSASIGNGTLTLAVSGSGLSGSASFTANQSGSTTFTVTSNATTSATANTLVYRDAGGHITGNYGFFAYINTSDNDETGITRFVIKNGDNYHRSATTTTAMTVIRGVASGTWGIDISGNSATTTNFRHLGANVSYDNDRTTKVSGGLAVYSGYSTGANRPTTYDISAQFSVNGNMGMEIAADWISTSGPTLFARSLRDCCQNWSSWVTLLTSLNYNSYSPTLTGGGASGTWSINITGSAGSASSASSVPWAGVTAGIRTNYNLVFQPPSNSYAGFEFSTSTGGGAGYFLVRGTSDTDVYTAEGITLVADAGWLTLAQRTTSNKGVRIMTGASSTTRIEVVASGMTTVNSGLTVLSGLAWNNAIPALNVGGSGDARIQVRHIWGKEAGTANPDHLWLQYTNSTFGVQIGASGGSNPLYVAGNIYMGGYFGGNLVATQSWVTSQGYITGSYLPLSGGTLSGTLTIGGAVGSYIWNDGSGTYIEAYGNSTATRKIRIQGNNGSGSYAQWFVDAGNQQIYGEIGGYANLLFNSSVVYLRYNGSDKFWTGSDGTRTQGWSYYQDASAGMHWPSNGWHLLPSNSADFRIHSGNASESSLRMETNGITRGYFYTNSSNEIGILNSGRSWGFRMNNSLNAFIHGQTLTINADNAGWSSIYMNDGDEGMREIHCNSNRIGFLTQAGSWGSWCGDGGDWFSDHSMRAPIFYDSDNTTYYANFADTGTSINIAGSINAATYNKPGLLLNASGSTSSGAAFGMQQITSEGWSGIFVDYEPYTGWGLYHDNPANYFLITSESSTGSFGGGFTVPSRVSGNRTAYVKHRLDQNNGDFIAGGNIYMTGGTLVATQSWVNSQGFITGGSFLPYGNWSGNTGMNDYRLYLRTSGDTNHYLWNAADDWEELGAYAGTGFRVTSNNGANGLLYVYGSSNGGYTYSPYSFRAPIFYDSDNTAYYANFADSGTSVNIAGKITTAISGGTIISHGAMTDAFGYNGSYGTYIGSPVGGTYYIYANGTFYDAGTIRTFLHSGNYSSYAIARGGDTVDGIIYYRTNLGAYSGSLSGARLQVYNDNNQSAFMSFHRSGQYAVNFGLDQDNVLRIGGWSAAADRWVLDMSGNNTVAGSFRAPIFYDSADTSYYWNPNTSSAHRLGTPSGYLDLGPMNGGWCHFQTDRPRFYFGNSVSVDGDLRRYSDSALYIHSANYNSYSPTLTGGGASGTWSISITGDANTVDGVDSSQIVYGGSGRASNYDGSMNDPNQKSGFFYKDNPTGQPFGDWWNWMTVAGNSWQSSNNYSFQLAHAFHSDDFYVRRMTNGTAYSWRYIMTSANSPYAYNMNQYVRTSDAPTFNGVYTNDWFRANGCTGFYFQSYGHGLRAPECEGNNYGNVCTYGGGRNGWAGYGITASFTMMGRSGTDVGLHDNGSSWIFYSPYGTQRLGFGTSTTSASYRIYVSGAIYATGDVVAYSDRRKKTDIVTIDNALEKVTNLRGVFYTKIGEEKKGRKTGVIAQEINEVLPEVVTYASDTDEYGVSYGNIAGVLIEAIKEQNELIKTLKSEIDQLKAKLE